MPKGPRPAVAAGRSSQAAHNSVSGRCECGDSAARGWEWDSPNFLSNAEDKRYLEVQVDEESAVAHGCLGYATGH